MLEAVVFDMDGLLLDTERPALASWLRAAGELGLALPEQAVLATIGVNWEGTKRIIMEALGADAPFEELQCRTQRYYKQWFADFGVQAKPGAEELLRRLGERGIPAALATSTARKSAEWKLRSAGLFHLIGSGACGDEVEHGKPHPDIFLLAAGNIGAAPGHCVALEDSPAGLMAAKAAGMTTVMVPDLVPPTGDTLQFADYIAKDLFRAGELIFGTLLKMCK